MLLLLGKYCVLIVTFVGYNKMSFRRVDDGIIGHCLSVSYGVPTIQNTSQLKKYSQGAVIKNYRQIVRLPSLQIAIFIAYYSITTKC